MKKTKFLALALVVGLMLMGAVYAVWTDTFKVTNTVNTGNLDVSMVENSEESYADVYLVDAKNTPNGVPVLDKHYNRITENNNYYNINFKTEPKQKSIDFTFENIFPGVTSTLYFTLQNKGTVPATVQGVRVNVEGEGKLKNALQVYSRFYIKDSDGNEIKRLEGNWENLDDLQNGLTNLLKGQVLKGGETISTGTQGEKNMWFIIPGDSLNGHEGEKETVKITIDFDFIQSNL